MAVFDPYRTLGLTREATPAQIRAAFRRAVRRHHPDTASSPDDGTGVRRVLSAYRLLIDPAARSRYDADHPVTGLADSQRVAVRRTRPSAPPPSRKALFRCSVCVGSGVQVTDTVCPECQGHAEYTILNHVSACVVRCRVCRGGGAVRARRPCPECGGTGVARS